MWFLCIMWWFLIGNLRLISESVGRPRQGVLKLPFLLMSPYICLTLCSNLIYFYFSIFLWFTRFTYYSSGICLFHQVIQFNEHVIFENASLNCFCLPHAVVSPLSSRNCMIDSSEWEYMTRAREQCFFVHLINIYLILKNLAYLHILKNLYLLCTCLFA